jgi:hypothetical protein
MVALGLLVAAMVVWAALPLGTAVLIRLVLIVAVLSGLLALIRLAVIQLAPGGRAGPGRDRGIALYDWPGSGLWQWLRELPGALPWGQVLIVAVLVLEALHPARPWHTAVLATLLLGFLVGCPRPRGVRTAAAVHRRGRGPGLAVGRRGGAAGRGRRGEFRLGGRAGGSRGDRGGCAGPAGLTRPRG